MQAKYQVKRLGRVKRYLGGHFHYKEGPKISISSGMLEYNTFTDAVMLQTNSKRTP